MRIQLAALGLMTVGLFSFSALAHDANVCTKAGAEVKVAGHDDKEQKADCEKQGGSWAKHKHDEKHEGKQDAGHDDKKQGSGGGGGW